MTERFTKKQGSRLRLTRETKRPSPFKRLDVARALGASHVIEHRATGGNPLARAGARSLWVRVLLAEAELPADDVRLVEELRDSLRSRLETDVDRLQILRALVHLELRQLPKDRERIEDQIAKYLTETSARQDT